MRKLIILLLITNQLTAQAYSNMQAQNDAFQLQMNLQRQAQNAMQQGNYDYDYTGHPGYYQLQQQAFAAQELRDQLRQQERMINNDDY